MFTLQNWTNNVFVGYSNNLSLYESMVVVVRVSVSIKKFFLFLDDRIHSCVLVCSYNWGQSFPPYKWWIRLMRTIDELVFFLGIDLGFQMFTDHICHHTGINKGTVWLISVFVVFCDDVGGVCSGDGDGGILLNTLDTLWTPWWITRIDMF